MAAAKVLINLKIRQNDIFDGLLTALRKEQDIEAKLQMLTAIAEPVFFEESAVRVVLKFLSDQDARIRRRAAYAIGKMLGCNAPEDVRKKAASELTSINPLFPKVEKIFAIQGLKLLAFTEMEEIGLTLLSMLGDDDHDVKMEAGEALSILK